MTFEAFRDREGRIAADLVEKLSQKQNIGGSQSPLSSYKTVGDCQWEPREGGRKN